MKVRCMKCYREMQVRARDLREVGATAKPWDISNLHDSCEDRLGCPFCRMERGGFYPLERIVAEPAGEVIG